MKQQALSIILLLFLVLAAAVEAFVDVAPPVGELTVKHGKRAVSEFVITNTKPRPVTVQIELKEWWSQYTGVAGLAPEKWLSIQTKPFTLRPLQKRTMRYSVRMPKEFKGEAMVMVFFNVDSSKEEGGGVSIQLRHGIPIYVVAENTEEINVNVKDIAPYFVDDSTSSLLGISVLLENKGNVHVRPDCRVSIAGCGDAQLEYGWPIYPNTEHRYSGNCKTANAGPGSYTADVEILCGSMSKNDVRINRSVEFSITNDRKIIVKQKDR